MRIRRLLASLLACAVLYSAACKKSQENAQSQENASVPPPQPIKAGNYTAEITTDMGAIDVQLFAKEAPLTVGNFVGLARGTQPWLNPATMQLEHNKPFFDGLTFHRVIPKFMIQGGDPLGTGQGNPGYQFRNEETPGLTYDRPGRLGMANAGPDTNGSQFFITTTAQPHLNGGYTIFGQVTKGQEIVDAISNVPRDASDKPLKPVHITHIEIRELQQ
jgi:peptidyl-prolyl cis-trans isomerase A (cyclophilin A)